jgi:hypothetical protein
MNALEYTRAFFASHPKVVEIRNALQLAEKGDDRSAFVQAAGLTNDLNGVERHALSDAIYALIAHAKENP